MFAPHSRFVDRSDVSAFFTSSDDGVSKAGWGECLPEFLEGGLSTITTSHGDGLLAEDRSLPVENIVGTLVDTTSTNNLLLILCPSVNYYPNQISLG
jgi:hypothetical protein